MNTFKSVLVLGIFLGGMLPACGEAETSPEVDSTVAIGDTPASCSGDELLAAVTISDDRDALRERFNTNKDLLRVVFVGEPN